MTKYKTLKSGLSTAKAYPERPMRNEKPIPLSERARLHKERHPKDLGVSKPNKGVTFGKKTERDKKLEEFHKNNVWTWVSRDKKGWVFIGNLEEEE